MKKFIRRLRPFFRRYGRKSRAMRKLKRRGYFTSALARPVNEFSRIATVSNIPNTVVSRTKAAFVLPFVGVSNNAPYGARIIRGNFPITPSVFDANYHPNNISRYTDFY